MRPICAYCHNKIHDNVYIWVESEKKVIHKVCKIITSEMRKDVVVKINPIRLGTDIKRGE